MLCYFYFQGSGLPLLVSGCWLGSMCRAYIALQEFQAIAVMLCWLCGYWVWPTSMVLLLFQHKFLLTSIWRMITCPRTRCFQSGIFSLGWSSRGGPAGILLYHSMPTLLHLGALGLCALDISGKLHVSCSCISSSSSVQVSGRSCHRSTQMFDSGGTLLDGGSLSPTVLNMLAVIPWQCPIINELVIDVLVGLVLKGLQYLHFTLWLLSNACNADRGSLPKSFQAVSGGNSSIYIKGLPAVLEDMGRLVCSTECMKQCHICS